MNLLKRVFEGKFLIFFYINFQNNVLRDLLDN
jgi:hypothetical protein